MKPRNFPGRQELRRARAQARLEGRPAPQGDPVVTDTRFRVGKGQRGLNWERGTGKARG